MQTEWKICCKKTTSYIFDCVGGGGKTHTLKYSLNFCRRFCDTFKLDFDDETIKFTAIPGQAAALFPNGRTTHFAIKINSNLNAVKKELLGKQLFSLFYLNDWHFLTFFFKYQHYILVQKWLSSMKFHFYVLKNYERLIQIWGNLETDLYLMEAFIFFCQRFFSIRTSKK